MGKKQHHLGNVCQALSLHSSLQPLFPQKNSVMYIMITTVLQEKAKAQGAQVTSLRSYNWQTKT